MISSNRSRNGSAKEGIGSLQEEFDNAHADYSMAKQSRFRRQRQGVTRVGRGADWHTRIYGDNLLMMELARDMDRNDTVVGQCITRATENTVQDGMTLDPDTGDAKINVDLKARFENWGGDPDQCDLAGEMTFNEQEELAVRAPIVDGDMFFLPMADGQLQAVEAHRCRTPGDVIGKFKLIQGVMLSPDRKRKQYWFTPNDIDPFVATTTMAETTKYAARDEQGNRQVFHIYDPKRFSQTRGVSALAPIVDVCGMFEDINFAKLVQQQVCSCFAILRNRAVNWRGPATEPTGAVSQQGLTDGSVRQLEGVSPGMDILSAPGETISGFSPNIVNADFTQHVRLMLQLIGINLGLPLVMVLMDASETNFSGWRGAVDEARRHFRRNQRHLICKFHRPVYQWKVRQWLSDDPVLARAAKRGKIDVFAHRWNRPGWPYIDPLKDVGADLLEESNGLISPRRLHARKGVEFNDIWRETIEDNSLRIAAAMAATIVLNKKAPPGQEVHWREVASLPLAKGLTVKLDASEDAPPAAANKKTAGAK